MKFSSFATEKEVEEHVGQYKKVKTMKKLIKTRKTTSC
jgi:hypothetical protein